MLYDVHCYFATVTYFVFVSYLHYIVSAVFLAITADEQLFFFAPSKLALKL